MPKHEGSALITMEKNNNILLFIIISCVGEKKVICYTMILFIRLQIFGFDSFGIISYYFLNFLLFYIRAIIVVVAS